MQEYLKLEVSYFAMHNVHFFAQGKNKEIRMPMGSTNSVSI